MPGWFWDALVIVGMLYAVVCWELREPGGIDPARKRERGKVRRQG